MPVKSDGSHHFLLYSMSSEAYKRRVILSHLSLHSESPISRHLSPSVTSTNGHVHKNTTFHFLVTTVPPTTGRDQSVLLFGDQQEAENFPKIQAKAFGLQ